jgi:hypothetical protein
MTPNHLFAHEFINNPPIRLPNGRWLHTKSPIRNHPWVERLLCPFGWWNIFPGPLNELRYGEYEALE